MIFDTNEINMLLIPMVKDNKLNKHAYIKLQNIINMHISNSKISLPFFVNSSTKGFKQ